MRLFLISLYLIVALPVSANFSELIAAVKINQITRAAEILAQKDKDGKPAVNIDEVDENGRPPVFYVCSAEMLEMLIARGAHVYGLTAGDEHKPRVDSDGMNALHVLLAETAPRLLADFPEHTQSIMRNIEATGYLLMRTGRLYEIVKRPRIPLETQVDNYFRLPTDFIEGRGPFIDRLLRRHAVEYRAEPEGGVEAAKARRLAKRDQLQAAWNAKIAKEKERERKRRARYQARMLAIMDTELVAFEEVPPPVLTLVVPERISPRIYQTEQAASKMVLDPHATSGPTIL